MVASIILMLQSLNITRQNTTLTLSFPFLRYMDIYTHRQFTRYSGKNGTRSKEIKVLQILLMLSTGHEKA